MALPILPPPHGDYAPPQSVQQSLERIAKAFERIADTLEELKHGPAYSGKR